MLTSPVGEQLFPRISQGLHLKPRERGRWTNKPPFGIVWSFSLNSNGLLKIAWGHEWDGHTFPWNSASSTKLLKIQFPWGSRNQLVLHLSENRAQWKYIERKNWNANCKSFPASPSMSQPNTSFQLMSFHIKYATKNPSGHSIHFQHPPTSQAKCIQRLKGTSVLRRKKLSLASEENQRYASVGNHALLSPLEMKTPLQRGVFSSASKHFCYPFC